VPDLRVTVTAGLAQQGDPIAQHVCTTTVTTPQGPEALAQVVPHNPYHTPTGVVRNEV